MVGVVGIVVGVVEGAVVVAAGVDVVGVVVVVTVEQGEESWLQHLHDASKYVLAAQGIDTAWP